MALSRMGFEHSGQRTTFCPSASSRGVPPKVFMSLASRRVRGGEEALRVVSLGGE